jgi:starch phosphorylase
MTTASHDESSSRPEPSVRTGLGHEALARDFQDNLFSLQGRDLAAATHNDLYLAMAYTVRDRLLQRWIRTVETMREGAPVRKVKSVCYLSAEFLTGPHLGNNLVNLGILEEARAALDSLGISLDALLRQEEEPGLGNGGLGRLAACFLDSLATLEIPATGYGIRYEYGIFDQEIRDGWQIETTDLWLGMGNPWEIPRPELAQQIGFGGRTEAGVDEDGRYKVRWIPERRVKGVPYDTPIPGYRVNTCNTLRLWTAEAVTSFDLHAFNEGDYFEAVEQEVVSKTITKILYPNDETDQGRRLRLEQQYFFTSCALRDMIRILHALGESLDALPERFAVQLNDTHPSIAVAELMRLLVDEHGMDWEPAWSITRRALAYTNHTLLPEALEKWPLPMFQAILPRHLEIIMEINRRFLDDEVGVAFPGDGSRRQRLSIIDESGSRFVRMAHLACVGTHAINGVAALHSRLLATDVLRDFHDLWPEKFTNVTNGVTPRRWIVLSNPRLADLVSSRIGPEWVRSMETTLDRLEPAAEDSAFRDEWRAVKRANKVALADIIAKRTGVIVDPDSLFDIQVKRIHEYKRQHLNILQVLTRYLRIKADPTAEVVPRTVIFGGKAAPGYYMAKLIIKLITSAAAKINADPDVRDRLKVVFLPDFNVTNAQPIYPAADLSEQISTAGKEASGTGNMKFSMNGALTIGTMDGANVEIREAVGTESFFLFGLTADEVGLTLARGYLPSRFLESNARLRNVLDYVASGALTPEQPDLFRPLVDGLRGQDPFLVLADFEAYCECQDRVDQAFRDVDAWTRASILNAARVGHFSSDRAIREYCQKIWRVSPLPVVL